MRIRQARVEDAEAIAEIWNVEIRDGVSTFNSIEKTLAELCETIETRGAAFLVAETEHVIGFATYFQFRGGIGYAHTMEHTIYVSADGRGTGAGRSLMRQLEKNARAAGVHSLFAGIGGENEAGIAFHSAIGFQHTAVLPQVGYKFGRWMDLVLMQKFL